MYQILPCILNIVLTTSALWIVFEFCANILLHIVGFYFVMCIYCLYVIVYTLLLYPGCVFCILNTHSCVVHMLIVNIVVCNFPSRRALALQSSGSQVIDNPSSWTSIVVTIITIVAIAIGFKLEGQKNCGEIWGFRKLRLLMRLMWEPGEQIDLFKMLPSAPSLFASNLLKVKKSTKIFCITDASMLDHIF